MSAPDSDELHAELLRAIINDLRRHGAVTPELRETPLMRGWQRDMTYRKRDPEEALGRLVGIALDFLARDRERLQVFWQKLHESGAWQSLTTADRSIVELMFAWAAHDGPRGGPSFPLTHRAVAHGVLLRTGERMSIATVTKARERIRALGIEVTPGHRWSDDGGAVSTLYNLLPAAVREQVRLMETSPSRAQGLVSMSGVPKYPVLTAEQIAAMYEFFAQRRQEREKWQAERRAQSADKKEAANALTAKPRTRRRRPPAPRPAAPAAPAPVRVAMSPEDEFGRLIGDVPAAAHDAPASAPTPAVLLGMEDDFTAYLAAHAELADLAEPDARPDAPAARPRWWARVRRWARRRDDDSIFDCTAAGIHDASEVAVS